jgi:hypothetical protein
MMVLTDEQFDLLEKRLQQAQVRQSGLYHDLLDHFYCLTTVYMEKGKPFHEALDMAQQELAPEGFSDIDREVTFFLTFDFQIRMNKFLYGGAFVAAFGQTLYVLFRTLRWPGSEYFLMMAVSALFIFLIPGLVHKYRENAPGLSQAVRIRILSGLVGLGLFGLGSAFKVMHWIAANVQIILGTALLTLVFFPLYFWQMYKQETFKQEMA